MVIARQARRRISPFVMNSQAIFVEADPQQYFMREGCVDVWGLHFLFLSLNFRRSFRFAVQEYFPQVAASLSYVPPLSGIWCDFHVG